MTSSTADKYTTTEYGKQNMFGAEVAPWVDENDNYEGYAVNAEKTNGRWAMIGIVALLGAGVGGNAGAKPVYFIIFGDDVNGKEIRQDFKMTVWRSGSGMA